MKKGKRGLGGMADEQRESGEIRDPLDVVDVIREKAAEYQAPEKPEEPPKKEPEPKESEKPKDKGKGTPGRPSNKKDNADYIQISARIPYKTRALVRQTFNMIGVREKYGGQDEFINAALLYFVEAEQKRLKKEGDK